MSNWVLDLHDQVHSRWGLRVFHHSCSFSFFQWCLLNKFVSSLRSGRSSCTLLRTWDKLQFRRCTSKKTGSRVAELRRQISIEDGGLIGHWFEDLQIDLLQKMHGYSCPVTTSMTRHRSTYFRHSLTAYW